MYVQYDNERDVVEQTQEPLDRIHRPHHECASCAHHCSHHRPFVLEIKPHPLTDRS